MFNKKPDNTMAKSFSSSTQRSSAASGFSVLGGDTLVTGNIEALADLHIDGRVIGDLVCTALVQGETSEIVGAITAETVRIAGTVRGTIHAREVVVLKSAKIDGDIAYDALTIEQGARLDGRLNPNGGQQPPAITRLAEESALLPAE